MHDKSERTKYDYRLPHFQDYAAPDLPQVTDDQLYLVGALLAEGWLNQARAVNGGAYVAIGQSMFANERVALQIKEAIHTLGLRGRESSKNDGMVEWVFNADDSKRILSWFDTLNLHVMPRYFYSLSRRQSEIVFRAMMDCDGCWSSMTYHSKRYLLAVDFQTIAHLAGYRTSQLRSRPDGSYEVNVIVKRKKHTYFQQVSEQSDGQQEVWCVQTRNGTIITRDHDCLSISGNCEAMWLMLQQDEPDDYVVGTGETHSVREFLSAAFERAGLDWQKYVEIDPQYYRPAEVDLLVADASKAERKLGWRPQTTFRELVSLMVDADIAALRGNQSQGATNVSVGK
ncbi:MAG: GDP-mannose 4,6-dehydratase [Pyrinomonadaceae bacterium]